MPLAVGLPLAGFGPAVGAGFARDDFRWLWHARLDGADDLVRLLTEHLGFYRPVTSLAWAVDLLRAGPDPLAFAVTNLALHVATLLLFGMVAARLSRPTGPGPATRPSDPWPAAAVTALVAVLLAGTSHHYSRTAVLWISGRGALLGASLGTAAVLLWDGWLRGRGGRVRCLTACGLAGLAAFSYEAALGTTLLLAAMVPLRGRPGRRGPGWTLPPLAVLGVYLVARSGLGAMQPWAPRAGYGYRAGAVLPNLLEYLGRAVVPGLAVLLLLLLLAVACGRLRRTMTACRDGALEALPLGAGWFLLGVLPALPVPRRSDLYVYFAALGIHLLAATAVARGFRELRSGGVTGRRRAGVGAGVLVALLLLAWLPWAWGRNDRLADPARLATAAVAELRDAPVEAGEATCWIFDDRRDLAPDLHDAFSDHLPWVVAFARGVSPEPDARWGDEVGGDPREGCETVVRLTLLDGGEAGLPALGLTVEAGSGVPPPGVPVPGEAVPGG